MTAPPHRPPARTVFLKGAVWIALITAAVIAIEHQGWLHGLEMAGLDFFIRQQSPALSDRIFVVEITDADYEHLFGNTSPLKARELGTLIRSVLAVKPSVVGVDIDTSDERFKILAGEFHLDADARVVWASVPHHVPATPAEAEEPLRGTGMVMGSPPKRGMRYGLPLFPFEPDGAVRLYRRVFELEREKPEEAASADSLPWAVVKALSVPPPRGGDEVILNFRGDNTKFPVIQSREFLEEFRPQDPRWSALEGKIILIGGSYSAARDEYSTAVGRMAGVELIAHAIQGDLKDENILEFSHTWAILIDVAIGFGIVAAFYYIRSVRLAFWTSLFGATLLAIGGSRLAFRSATYWIDFVPILIGMLIHQLVDHAERHRELRHELDHACAELTRLKAEMEAKAGEA